MPHFRLQPRSKRLQHKRFGLNLFFIIGFTQLWFLAQPRKSQHPDGHQRTVTIVGLSQKTYYLRRPMTFGLNNWLKSCFSDISYEVPLFYPATERPDEREWIVTNGLGGYSSSTVCGTHIRR